MDVDETWRAICEGRPVEWAQVGENVSPSRDGHHGIGVDAVRDAAARWKRFEPVLGMLFPREAPEGRIVSPLLPVPELARSMLSAAAPPGVAERIYVKADHLLPIAGSIKARGGLYEVLCFAERIGFERGLLSGRHPDYRALATPKAQQVFADYDLLVGSTGNLGYAVGLAATTLGFRAIVHMSHEAKAWKKDRLRACGATVVEHPGDYTMAVAAAREAASTDVHSHFVDDEASRDLFLGYTGAAVELDGQLHAAGIEVSAAHPLFVYLPCGVGGAPGGVLYGLRQLYGENVLGFFAQSTRSPSLLLRLVRPAWTGSVYDVGLDNLTIADGMAVARASDLVTEVVGPYVTGGYTVTDNELLQWVSAAHETERLRLEPAAASGFAGALQRVWESPRMGHLRDTADAATHVIWTTGGSRLPDAEFSRLLNTLGPDLESRPQRDVIGGG